MSLWQCDFFSRRILTPRGVRQAFVLAFIHVQTRRVILSPATFKPDAHWVAEQARAFVSQARQQGLSVARLLRDNDGAFTPAFDEALRRQRVNILKTAIRAPNMNAYAERFVQSIKRECLDHFIVFGTQHLNHLCAAYLAHYHTERPHQGRDNQLLAVEQRKPTAKKSGHGVGDDTDLPKLSDIRCRSRLGGLLKHYERRAA